MILNSRTYHSHSDAGHARSIAAASVNTCASVLKPDLEPRTLLALTPCAATHTLSQLDEPEARERMVTAETAGTRMQRIEHSLVPQHARPGDETPAATLAERMAYLGVPGVSVALIAGGEII